MVSRLPTCPRRAITVTAPAIWRSATNLSSSVRSVERRAGSRSALARALPCAEARGAPTPIDVVSATRPAQAIAKREHFIRDLLRSVLPGGKLTRAPADEPPGVSVV